MIKSENTYKCRGHEYTRLHVLKEICLKMQENVTHECDPAASLEGLIRPRNGRINTESVRKTDRTVPVARITGLGGS
jgi:hypothetical protein